MADRFDVIVVGARVAGAPLATHLAREGLRVCVVDRAQFPSDTLSTHIFQNLECIERLGVLGRLLDTGAPLMPEGRIILDGDPFACSVPDMPMLCVRRPTLDQVLLDNAIDAGVEVRTHTRVTDLVEDNGRVAGVRTKDATGTVTTLRAQVVVGADGRNSTIARLAGARRYNVTSNERGAAWTYYEGVDAPARLDLWQFGEALIASCPADGGVYLVIALSTLSSFPAFRDSTGNGFDRAIASWGPLAEIIGGGRRIRKPVLVPRYPGYFRESAGPGWCLVGDAGHFKDPVLGQGISDALRQAERLAEFVVTGLRDGSPDEQLRTWWSWRDLDAMDLYWFAQDMARGGAPTPLMNAILRSFLSEPDGARKYWELLNHRLPPSKLLSPGRLIAVTSRLLAKGTVPRREVLAEVRDMMALERQRRRLKKRPQFEPDEASPDAPDDDVAVA